MRISVKVAPGMRVSGRVGGRRHHHHHHSIRIGSAPSTQRPGGWLHNPPPWRMPRTHVHGIGGAIAWLFLAEIFACIWIYEAAAWLYAWMFIGIWRGCRWVYKRNVVGQTVATIAPGRRPRPAPYDPHGAPARPVDLTRLAEPDADPWDTGQTRSRG